MMRLIFTILLGLNLWIWRMFSSNILVGLVVVFASLIFYLHLFEKKKVPFKLIVLSLALLFVLQLRVSDPESLTSLSNDQKRIQAMRLREYPITRFPLAHWFEGRKETIAFFRIIENFSEVVDPNLYFFANHPRERIGYEEFEKFPYILLPFFVIGALALYSQKRHRLLFLSTASFLVLFSIVGDTSNLGPFALFPFILISSVEGIRFTFLKVFKSRKSVFIMAFVLIYAVVFIQTISYAVY